MDKDQRLRDLALDVVKYPYKTQKERAEEMGVHVNTIGKDMRSDDFKAEKERLTMEYHAEHAHQALDELRKMAMSEDTPNRTKAMELWLRSLSLLNNDINVNATVKQSKSDEELFKQLLDD